jgi:peptidoglycan/LPS O-acetylase OafA/YrhL
MTAPGVQSLRPRKYIPQFDGLRGIAILAVLLAHLAYIPQISFARIFEYGRMGVDLFFVLSGFLITGILVDSKQLKNYFRNFYARRALRIWPVYYAVLAVFFVLIPLFFGHNAFDTGERTWGYYVTYTQNLFLSFHHAAPLQPTWSLAVEEQYYAGWALVVFLFGRAALRNWLIGMILFSTALRAIAYFHGASLEFLHDFTLCRLEPLATGGLAALWLRSPRINLLRWSRGAWIGVLLGLGGITLVLVDWGVRTVIFNYAFVASLLASLVALALAATPSSVGGLLCQRWLTYTGKISYGIYLIHVPVFMAISYLAQRTYGGANLSRYAQILLALAAFLAVAVIASLSWRYFEQPILRWKEKFRTTNQPCHAQAAQ